MARSAPPRVLNVVDATDLLADDFEPRQELQDGSMREFLSHYLAYREWMRGASRKKKAEAQNGPMDHYYLYQIDKMLGRVLAGDDARTVFKLEKKVKGRPLQPVRDRAIALEAARFQNADGTLDPNAAGQIADKFDVDSKTVRRKHKSEKVTRAELGAYIRMLKRAGRLPRH